MVIQFLFLTLYVMLATHNFPTLQSASVVKIISPEEVSIPLDKACFLGVSYPDFQYVDTL